MTDEQERHLDDIKDEFISLVDPKYRAGVLEHKGFLGDVPPLKVLDMAIEEAVDQVVYLLTLKQQLSKLKNDKIE